MPKWHLKLQRLDRLDRKQLENEQKFEKVFAKFEENEPRRQGIFYDGESYDAYTFVSDRIREARTIILSVCLKRLRLDEKTSM